MYQLSESILKLYTAPPQLPVTAYFDKTLFQYEIDVLFKSRAQYIGHELMVPEIGDYFSLLGEKNGRVLVRNAQNNIEVLSNVCRHRQAIMLKGRGNTQNIVCPLHRWTYDLKGKLLGAPHFPENPCLNLAKTSLKEWRGLLFESEKNTIHKELATLNHTEYLNFSGYGFDHAEVHECHYNWKTFIEVYLEDYHVQPFHPGLGNFVNCDDLTWEFGDSYSLQMVGARKNISSPGSTIYQQWQSALSKFDSTAFPFGAIWMLLYPNIMIEWYPHVLVVSHLIPRGPQHTTNLIEFYYPQEIALFERELVEAQRAAYMETTAEDDAIALRMDEGRLALMERGTSEIGPYQEPMESGMRHFHQYLRKNMGDIIDKTSNIVPSPFKGEG